MILPSQQKPRPSALNLKEMVKLRINVRDVNETTALVTVNGEIDVHSNSLFIEKLDEVEQDRIILDLEGAAYFSSEGIGTIFSLLKETRDVGGDVVLLNPSRWVLDSLEILGAKDSFKITESLNEAVDAFDDDREEDEQSIKGNLRIFKRTSTTSITAILTDDSNQQHQLSVVDYSKKGIGCVYVGDHPPIEGDQFKLQKGKFPSDVVEVKWVRELEMKVFRIGLKFVV